MTRTSVKYNIEIDQSSLQRQMMQINAMSASMLMSGAPIISGADRAAIMGSAAPTGFHSFAATATPSLAAVLGVPVDAYRSGDPYLDKFTQKMFVADVAKDTLGFAGSEALATTALGTLGFTFGGPLGMAAGVAAGFVSDYYFGDTIRENITNPIVDTFIDPQLAKNRMAASLMVSTGKSGYEAVKYANEVYKTMEPGMYSKGYKGVSRDDLADIAIYGLKSGDISGEGDVKSFVANYKALADKVISAAKLLGETHRDVMDSLSEMKNMGYYDFNSAYTAMINEDTAAALTPLSKKQVRLLGHNMTNAAFNTPMRGAGVSGIVSASALLASSMGDQAVYQLTGSSGAEGVARITEAVSKSTIAVSNSPIFKAIAAMGLVKGEDGSFDVDISKAKQYISEKGIDSTSLISQAEESGANAVLEGLTPYDMEVVYRLTSKKLMEDESFGQIGFMQMQAKSIADAVKASNVPVNRGSFIYKAMSMGMSEGDAEVKWQLYNQPGLAKEIRNTQATMPAMMAHKRQIEKSKSISGRAWKWVSGTAKSTAGGIIALTSTKFSPLLFGYDDEGEKWTAEGEYEKTIDLAKKGINSFSDYVMGSDTKEALASDYGYLYNNYDPASYLTLDASGFSDYEKSKSFLIDDYSENFYQNKARTPSYYTNDFRTEAMGVIGQEKFDEIMAIGGGNIRDADKTFAGILASHGGDLRSALEKLKKGGIDEFRSPAGKIIRSSDLTDRQRQMLESYLSGIAVKFAKAKTSKDRDLIVNKSLIGLNSSIANMKWSKLETSISSTVNQLSKDSDIKREWEKIRKDNEITWNELSGFRQMLAGNEDPGAKSIKALINNANVSKEHDKDVMDMRNKMYNIYSQYYQSGAQASVLVRLDSIESILRNIASGRANGGLGQ